MSSDQSVRWCRRRVTAEANAVIALAPGFVATLTLWLLALSHDAVVDGDPMDLSALRSDGVHRGRPGELDLPRIGRDVRRAVRICEPG
jgi:hypothetical protein